MMDRIFRRKFKIREIDQNSHSFALIVNHGDQNHDNGNGMSRRYILIWRSPDDK